MYEEILLPVDDSSATSAVVRHAAEIAVWADATLHVLHVADTNRDSVTVVGSEVVDTLESEGESVVDETAGVLANMGAECRTDVVQGDPAETIVDYAERYGMDIVVMPTHGREGLSRYLLGSVSEKVVRLSPVPVLTTRMRDDEKLQCPYERLLVPVDGSGAAAGAADHALALAGAMSASVHVLSVVEDSVLGGDDAVAAASRTAAQDAVDAVVESAGDHDVTEVVSDIREGEPDEVIRAAIDEVDADAVVMGTTGRRGVDRILLGSVAEKTVRSAPVPVLTVADDD